jgi:Ala-tRNA(Pro) deacylase
MAPSAELEHYLQEHDIPYLMRHHAPAMTARQLAELENINPHEVAKVVVMRDQKTYYMLVLPADYKLDLKEVRAMINSRNAWIASEQDLQQQFPGCELGAMPPFGALYNMQVYVETDLGDDQEIEFNAGSHEDAIRMRYMDWKNMVHPNMGHFSYKYH